MSPNISKTVKTTCMRWFIYNTNQIRAKETGQNSVQSKQARVVTDIYLKQVRVHVAAHEFLFGDKKAFERATSRTACAELHVFSDCKKFDPEFFFALATARYLLGQHVRISGAL